MWKQMLIAIVAGGCVAACSQSTPADPEPQQAASAPTQSRATSDSPQPKWPACAAGLKARGVKDNEIWVMMHEPDGVCPNMGVDEARIRAIISNDWEAAGCVQFTAQQMLHALDSGACGGDAG